MRYVARTLIAIATIAATGWSASPMAVDTLPPVLDAPGIYGADPELAEIIDDAIDRFHAVGLTLPDLRIYVHPNKEGCGGATGRYRQHGDPHRIDLCNSAKFPYTILHELAHVWEHHNISMETRESFLDRTGLVWYDPGVEWKQRGLERVAEIISWALWEKPLTDGQAVEHAERLQLFELLTDTTSPRLEAD